VIQGFRLFLFPGVTATAAPFLDKLDFYQQLQQLNFERPDDDQLQTASPIDYLGTNSGSIFTVPNFTGQETDGASWVFQPTFDPTTGNWYSLKTDDDLWTGYPVPIPLQDDPQTSGQITTGLITAMFARPAAEPKIIATVSGYTGNTNIPATNAIGVNVTCTVAPPGVDQWYGAPGVGKYGWVAAWYADGSFGPIQWLNFLQSRVFFPLNA